MFIIKSLYGFLSHLNNTDGHFDGLFVANNLFIVRLIEILIFIKVLELFNKIMKKLSPFF